MIPMRGASVGKDSNQIELETKINALAARRYGSSSPENLKRLFLSYDRNGDGCLSSSELDTLLSNAGIGNFITRSYWVSGVVNKLDRNGNRCISWDEYCAQAYCGPPAVVAPKPVPKPVPVPVPGKPIILAVIPETGFSWPSRVHLYF